MKDSQPYAKECCIYPGEYTPMPEVEAFMEELKMPCKYSAAKPLIDMNERDGCFNMEVAMPGIKREDIFIQTHENILSIVVLPNNCAELKKNRLQLNECNGNCLVRNVLLPGNADIEFVSAEYRQGILSLNIPASGPSLKMGVRHIVVY